ncbi:RNA polymerase sigma factor [Bacillus phage BC01]|nr:putative RNA polymerase sigma 28 subunit SigG [Bacillus phage PBC6]AXU41213.1 RNA polymerase sigma factor [Bacillus phage BC01]
MYNLKHDILSDAETNDLLLQAQTGSETAMEQLVEGHVRLVNHTARRYYHPGYDSDDFLQMGMVGLMKAVRDYSFDKKVKFSTYVVTKVNGEIQTWLRDHSHVMRIPREISVVMRKIHANDLLYSTAEEISSKLEMDDIECIEEALKCIKQPLMYIECDVIDEENRDIKVKIMEIIEGDVNGDWESEITFDNLIATLGNRERTIIDLKYRHGLVNREIAPMFGVSNPQISRLERKAIRTLREKITGELIHS